MPALQICNHWEQAVCSGCKLINQTAYQNTNIVAEFCKDVR